MDEIIDFKSISEYFNDEKSGLKNHTERIIDINDERFQILLRAWKEGNYPKIRINLATIPDESEYAVTEDKRFSFIRQIRHIAIWNDIMCITWDV